MCPEELLTGHTTRDLPMQAIKFTDIKPGEKSSLAYRVCDRDLKRHTDARTRGEWIATGADGVYPIRPRP